MRERLSAELGIDDDETLTLLLHGLESAQGVQADCAPSVTLKEYKQALERLSNGLKKLVDGRGTPEAAHSSINKALDVVYTGAHTLYHTEVFQEICFRAKGAGWELSLGGPCECEYLARSLPRWKKSEDRVYMAELLLSHVHYKLSLISTPGKGGRRVDARRYVPGIRELEYWFRSAMPGYAISASENSVFYKYVCFWFTFLMQVENLSAPDRHIGAFIADKERWRPLSDFLPDNNN